MSRPPRPADKNRRSTWRFALRDLFLFTTAMAILVFVCRQELREDPIATLLQVFFIAILPVAIVELPPLLFGAWRESRGEDKDSPPTARGR
jgi:hypothetical protein